MTHSPHGGDILDRPTSTTASRVVPPARGATVPATDSVPAAADGVTANRYEFGIEFVWSDGLVMTLEYAQFAQGIFLGEAGLLLRFAPDVVWLRGRNLLPLLKRIKDHRQSRIEQVPRDKDFPDQAAWAVYDILPFPALPLAFRAIGDQLPGQLAAYLEAMG